MTRAQGSARALQTVAWLRKRIESGEWPLNSKIPTEPELVAAIGVGRSTVREAVRSLASQGMLETASGRGTFVRARTPVNGVLSDHMSRKDPTDLLQVRRALEVEAAGLAAERRTAEEVAHLEQLKQDLGSEVLVDPIGASPGGLHADIFEMARNPLLTELYGGVMAAVRAAIGRRSIVQGDVDQRRDDHAALLAALIEGDVAASRELAWQHCGRDLRITDN